MVTFEARLFFGITGVFKLLHTLLQVAHLKRLLFNHAVIRFYPDYPCKKDFEVYLTVICEE